MQWLYFDALECLAEEEGVLLTEEECAPVCVQNKSHTPIRKMAAHDGVKSVSIFSLFFFFFFLSLS